MVFTEAQQRKKANVNRPIYVQIGLVAFTSSYLKEK